MSPEERRLVEAVEAVLAYNPDDESLGPLKEALGAYQASLGGRFARVAWTVGNVKALRPLWDDESCARFLDSIEGDLEDATIEAGWGMVESELDILGDEGEEDEGPFPKDETDQVCESCGDPDCSRPFPHPVEKEAK